MFCVTNEETVNRLTQLSIERLGEKVSRRCILAAAELAHSLTHFSLKFGIGEWLHFSQEYLRKLILGRHCVEYLSGTVIPFLEDIGFLTVGDAHNNNAYKYLVDMAVAREISIIWLEQEAPQTTEEVGIDDPQAEPERFPNGQEPLKRSTKKIKEKKLNKKKKKKPISIKESASIPDLSSSSSSQKSPDSDLKSSALVIQDNTSSLNEPIKAEIVSQPLEFQGLSQLLTEEERAYPWFKESLDGSIYHQGFVEYLSQDWFSSKNGRFSYRSLIQARVHVERWLISSKTSLRDILPTWSGYRVTVTRETQKIVKLAIARGYLNAYEWAYLKKHYSQLPSFFPPQLIPSEEEAILLSGVGESVPIGEIPDDHECWAEAEAKATEVEKIPIEIEPQAKATEAEVKVTEAPTDFEAKATEAGRNSKATEIVEIDVKALIDRFLLGGQFGSQKSKSDRSTPDLTACDRSNNQTKRPHYPTIARLKEENQGLKQTIREELESTGIHPAEIPVILEERFNYEIRSLYQQTINPEPEKLMTDYSNARKAVINARQLTKGETPLNEAEKREVNALGNIRFFVRVGNRERVAKLINEHKLVVDIDWEQGIVTPSEF